MAERAWQLQLVKKSLKKREKLKLLNKYFCVESDDILLDLGCAQGILSYFLRKKGGTWLSVDLDFVNCRTALTLLDKNCLQLAAGNLPFKNGSFDKVVSLDYLEHLEDDDGCLKDIHRILKPGGELLLATPRTGRIFFLHKLRAWLGMKLEFYGHKRVGYNLKDLKAKLEQADLSPFLHRSFSGFLSEFMELLLNFFYIKFFSSQDPQDLRDGHIRPTTADEFSSKQKAFRLYSIIHPIIWLLTRLDKIFFFQRGYGLMVWAKKTQETIPYREDSNEA